MWETRVSSLGWEDALEKGMATHSSILVWEIPWTKEPGRLQSMGSQRVRHDWMTNTTKGPTLPNKILGSLLTKLFPAFGILSGTYPKQWCSKKDQVLIHRQGRQGYDTAIWRRSWTIKKAECWRMDAFKLWCWRRLLGVPWTARRSNQSIL